jgi:hypothetical protein
LNPDQTRQPVAGVRVLAGVKMSNPYPNPRQTRALTRGFSKPVTIPTSTLGYYILHISIAMCADHNTYEVLRIVFLSVFKANAKLQLHFLVFLSVHTSLSDMIGVLFIFWPQ